MEAVYNWSIKKILAKPVFTDKHGNVRENVLKTVVLEYKGTKGEEVLTEEAMQRKLERTPVENSMVEISL